MPRRWGKSVGDVKGQLTRVARALGTVTSQLFRCHGLQRVPPNADQVGLHDMAYWIIFLAILGGWYLVLYRPQLERLEALEGRREMLLAHTAAEKREAQRLQHSIAALMRGDPRAWERAARGRLGWLEPGEITDLEKWNLSHPAPVEIPRAPQDSQNRNAPGQNLPLVLPRPRIPMVPTPPPPPASSTAPGASIASNGRTNAPAPRPAIPPPAVPPIPTPARTPSGVAPASSTVAPMSSRVKKSR